MNNLLNSFNTKNAILVITSFSEAIKGKSSKLDFNAVSWHSEKTLTNLSKINKVVVIAQKINKRKSTLKNNNLLVYRTWQKGKLLSFINLFILILRLKNIQNILVQFEFNVFGGILPNLLLLAMLFILKLLGKNITFELHQVILDIKLLEKHINIKNPVFQMFFNLSLKIFYKILGISVSKIIVFEEDLKIRLSQFINAEKINVLSLSVEAKNTSSKTKSRNLIKVPKNKFIVMVFGFINGYKGVDWIVKTIGKYNKDKNIHLLIAGGKNPYLKNQLYYNKFYNSIVSEIKKYPNITHTGFIPEDKISSYFKACDLVVLPYEVFMSASGPFALALSYRKPIILSNVLSAYSNSYDFKNVLKKVNLSKDDLFFDLKPESLIRLLKKAKGNKSYYKNLVLFSKRLREERLEEKVIKKLSQVISKGEKPLYSFKPQIVLQS